MSKPNIKPTVTTRWLIDLLLNRGIPLGLINKTLGLPGATKEAQLSRLSVSDYLKLLNWAADYLQDNHFGLTTAELIQDDSFGPIVAMSYNSANMRELFLVLEEFDTLISSGLSISFKEGPIHSQIDYRVIVPTPYCPRHDIEQTLLMITNLFRRYTAPNWQPERINVTYEKPQDHHKAVETFGDVFQYEQPSNNLIFSSAYLNTQITDADPTLLALLREEIQKNLNNLRRHDNVISEVRYLIAMSISGDHCDSDAIAKQLYMSRRTMVRHLNNAGTSFKLIRDDVIEEMAKSALIHSNATISAIAHQLGFSETSAFDRAFKKLTGYTPRKYRQKLQLS